MKLIPAISVVLLGIVFLSYGVSASDAQLITTCGPDEIIENNQCVSVIIKNATPPLFIATDDPVYTVGERIKLTGSVKSYDGTFEITVRVFDPKNNLVNIDQLQPDTSGKFSTTIQSGTFWKFDGMYKIIANYGPYTTAETVFQFSTLTCKDNEIIQNGECVVKSKPVSPPENTTVAKDDPPKTDIKPTIKPVNKSVQCGEGTVMKDNTCVPEITPPSNSKDGGCLVATAAYGTEFSSQVQTLRELRDTTLLETTIGSSFMTEFNQIYYSFSPTVADLERSNPILKSTIQIILTPMLSSLSLLDIAESDSESQILTVGVGIIILNALLYIGVPIFIIHNIRKIQTPKMAKI